MHLDEHSDTPFYRQLEAQLREGIESGTYPTGSPPSEGWRPIWAARATPSSRPTICSCRKATWRAAPAAGTSCRT